MFIIGLGEDGIPARALAMKLAMIGILGVHHFDPVLMAASTATATQDDVLLVFSEQGKQTALCHLARTFRETGGKVVSVTRHTPNPLRAHADFSLLVSAHDERAHVEPLLYQSALQHLLDLIFILLCERGQGRLSQLDRVPWRGDAGCARRSMDEAPPRQLGVAGRVRRWPVGAEEPER